MKRRGMAVAVLLLIVAGVEAAPPLGTVSGRVVKANANVVIVRPPGPGGRPGKAQVLKVRGTSQVALAIVQQRGGKEAVVQRPIAPQDLQPDQVVAAVYTVADDEVVLLSLVALPRR